MNTPNPLPEQSILVEYQKRQRRHWAICASVYFCVLICGKAEESPVEAVAAGVWMLACIPFILVNWRCPKCDAYLGRCFHRRFCPKCGVQLEV